MPEKRKNSLVKQLEQSFHLEPELPVESKSHQDDVNIPFIPLTYMYHQHLS